eukprot:m.47302 g.47302  ORF g.47302 m.47302 type:complete len:55 (+) comp12315_c0_seq2:473-637(+)
MRTTQADMRTPIWGVQTNALHTHTIEHMEEEQEEKTMNSSHLHSVLLFLLYLRR